MLLHKPRILRLIASWLLVQTSTQLVWPTISYALTAGPTAPEATSFEPVDTTDMVNLASGDLTYNIPLLEVPGPEGGYPLSLAYHAGVQPDLEASWVGLGWTLNPGAINRSVNGYADDQLNTSQLVRDYWVGGVQQSYKIGVGVGLGDCASISAGLTFSNDTYRGFAVGEYASVGVGVESLSSGSVGVGVSAGISNDGYGNTNLGVSLGAGTKSAMSAGASIGVSTNFNSISANAGAGISVKAGTGRGQASNSLLGASISTDGGKFSVHSLGGSIGITNSTAGRIQTQSNGFALDIPIPGTPVFVALGYDYTRYWSDETDLAAVNGAIYYPLSYNSNLDLDKQAYDTYRISDPAHENIVDNPDPNWVRGGSFPDYDNYMVVAQGLGGSMRPYSFQRALYSRNKRSLTEDGDSYTAIKNSPLPWDNKPISFRFEGDFSNAYLQENTPITSLAYTFGSPQYGNADGNYGYTQITDRLAGSKHIDYYTNRQLLNPAGHPGIVEAIAKGFNRADIVAEHPEIAAQIGGFSITNTSGVTYHFSLPAYAFDEYTRSESIDDAATYNELIKRGYYAYTWFLTAITGPDYVDRGTGGIDDADWGYWVKFNYGKWSDHYGWRNPGIGYRSDIDAKVKTYSRGRKEIYYLNSIVTRTHTALFEKELRNDSKSATTAGFVACDETVTEKSLFIRNYDSDGKPRSLYTGADGFSRGLNPVNRSIIHEELSNSLRLKEIILLNNKDVPANLEELASDYNIPGYQSFAVTSYNPRNDRSYYTRTLKYTSQLGQNVLDSKDLYKLHSTLEQKSIRAIKFKHDYFLTPQTPNSFTTEGELSGKLTLNSVDFLGKQGLAVMPPTQFSYEPNPGEKQGEIILVKYNEGGFAPGNVGLIQPTSGPSNYMKSSYEPGDILRFKLDAKFMYISILDRLQNSHPVQYHVRYLTGIPQNPTTSTVSAQVTKNPPYLSDYHDWWGMFKNDYNSELTGLADGIARRTSEISNKGVDVWSLRTITSPLGARIHIGYEGDSYYKPVLSRPDMVCKADFAYATNVNFGVNINTDDGLLTKLTVAQAKSIFYLGQQIIINGLAPFDTLVSGSHRIFYKTVAKPTKITGIVASKQNPQWAVVATPLTNLLQVDGYAFSPSSPYYNYIPSIWKGTGYITLAKNNVINSGGGLRVKSVALRSNNQEKITQYIYNQLYLTKNDLYSLPSGTTSYEPGSVLGLDKNSIATAENNGHPNASEILDFKKRFTNSLFNLFAITREIPSPGIMYEAVTVKDNVTRADGKQIDSPNTTTYRFKVFKENMIGHTVTPTSEGNNRLYASLVSIKDFTSRIGSLLSITRYGENGRRLSQTVNHFLHDDLDNSSYEANSAADATGYQAKLARFNYQGVIQESFADSRDCRSPNDGQFDHKVVMTKRDVYPTIQTSTTTTDYVTGRSTSSETLGFDFYLGTATRTVTNDGYGNRLLTEVIPAYRKYPAMGLKLTNSSNRNMLSQTAATTIYKVDAANMPLSVVAATAQTWSDQVPVVGLTDNVPERLGTQAGIWRPWQSYSWLPTGTTVDGLTPMTGTNSFVGYDFSAASPPVPWKLTSQITLYNPYSNALEAKDVNGVYMATKLGFNQSKVLVSGGPAAYQELAYSGAEEEKVAGEYFSGGVALTWAPDNTLPAGGGPWGTTDVERSTQRAHTGQASLRVGTYKHGFCYTLNANTADPTTFHVDPTKTYRASVWTNDLAGQLYYWLDGADHPVSGTVQKRTADGWYLVEMTIPPIGGNRTTLRIGCYNSKPFDGNGNSQSVYFDDFRVQPLHAQVSSYVYDPLTGQVTDILDNNNLYTHYDYTSDGKLKRVSRETFQYGAKKVAEHSYHLAGILDASSLTVDATGLVTVNVPEAADPASITYDTGDGLGYRPLTTTARPYTFAAVLGQNRWIKVRLKDSQGNVRELVKHLI